MKKVLFFLCIIFSLNLNAQYYRVVTRNALNVRSGAGTEFEIIGKLASKDTVHVLSMERRWAQIEFGDQKAYVSNRYIVPLGNHGKKSAKEFVGGLLNLFKQGPMNYLPLLILLTLIFPLLVRRIFHNPRVVRFVVGIMGVVAICCMELIFFFGYEGLPWFCFPDDVGWLWMVVNYLLYGFVLYKQLALTLTVIREVCDENHYDLRLGIYSYPVAAGLGIIFYLADVDMGEYLFYAFLIAQGIQIVMNYFKIRIFWKASVVSVLFLLGSVAIICSAFFFVAILIFLVIIFLVLRMFASTRYVVVYD